MDPVTTVGFAGALIAVLGGILAPARWITTRRRTRQNTAIQRQEASRAEDIHARIIDDELKRLEDTYASLADLRHEFASDYSSLTAARRVELVNAWIAEVEKCKRLTRLTIAAIDDISTSAARMDNRHAERLLALKIVARRELEESLRNGPRTPFDELPAIDWQELRRFAPQRTKG